MDRNMIVGMLGLHFAYMPVHDTPLNEELTVLNIEIAPLQPSDFAEKIQNSGAFLQSVFVEIRDSR